MSYDKELMSKSGKLISLTIFESSKHPTSTIIETHGAYQVSKASVVYDSQELINFCLHNNINYVVVGLSNDADSVDQPISEIRFSDRIKDLETVIDFVTTEYSSSIILYGSSMGGFITLNAASYSPTIKKIILNCAAVKLHECVEAKNDKTEFDNWQLKGVAIIWEVPMTYDFYTDIVDHNALKVIPNIKVPILWFHGIEDEVVPIAQAREAKSLNPLINLVEVVGGFHRFGDQMKPGEWENTVEKFILTQ